MTCAKNQYDAALGCFLGACVGDAAGATLEFLGHRLTQDEVEHAMSMPGGGALRVAPGQITDDSELALCLADALSSSEEFDLERIAGNYAKWIRSDPFDIGMTTDSSLGCFKRPEWRQICEGEGFAVGMSRAAEAHCTESKANGSLMRIAPLGIGCHDHTDGEVAEYAIQDSRLSHPNESCCHAVACYSITIARLIRQPGDRTAALKSAYAWAQSHANEEVKGWLDEAKNNLNIPYHPQIGFIRIAFVHAFRHLWLGSDYVDAVRETLLGGGDTDTNACIVGGLVGAACGAEQIPEKMVSAVLACDTTKGWERPPFLRASTVPELVKALLRR